jgi:hypothetical protein
VHRSFKLCLGLLPCTGACLKGYAGFQDEGKFDIIIRAKSLLSFSLFFTYAYRFVDELCSTMVWFFLVPKSPVLAVHFLQALENEVQDLLRLGDWEELTSGHEALEILGPVLVEANRWLLDGVDGQAQKPASV